ncbi:MAG: hypothetical protein K9N00_00450 [Candidatus Marinimicrobia bacterium]|nr:hypothetical protein [Candidatus Neomarinimicrobiota bacterium]
MSNKNIFYIILIIFSIALIIFGIHKKATQENPKNNSYSQQAKRVIKQNDRIVGDTIRFVSNELNLVEEPDSMIYILVFHEADCGSCIRKGISFINSISDNSYILYLSDKEEKNNYRNMDNLVRKENINHYLEKISYITTPVIIKFDSSYKARDTFFPGVHKDSEFSNFME